MILALFGTNPYPFNRLANWMDDLAIECNLDIVVQTGSTRSLEHCRSFDYKPYDQIINLMHNASCVISQGGYGGCIDALSNNVPLIMVPRLKELNECRDDQTELTSYLAAHTDALQVESYEALKIAVLGFSSYPTKLKLREDKLGKCVADLIKPFLD